MIDVNYFCHASNINETVLLHFQPFTLHNFFEGSVELPVGVSVEKRVQGRVKVGQPEGERVQPIRNQVWIDRTNIKD